MGLFSGPKIPRPKLPDAGEPIPTRVDANVLMARKRERVRAGRSQGRKSTILTSPQGLPSLINERVS